MTHDMGLVSSRAHLQVQEHMKRLSILRGVLLQALVHLHLRSDKQVVLVSL